MAMMISQAPNGRLSRRRYRSNQLNALYKGEKESRKKTWGFRKLWHFYCQAANYHHHHDDGHGDDDITSSKWRIVEPKAPFEPAGCPFKGRKRITEKDWVFRKLWPFDCRSVLAIVSVLSKAPATSAMWWEERPFWFHLRCLIYNCGIQSKLYCHRLRSLWTWSCSW